MALPRYRALSKLQAPSLGLLQPGAEFDWDKPIAGWAVEPVNAEAEAQLAKEGGKPWEPPPVLHPFSTLQTVQAGMSAARIVSSASARGLDQTTPHGSKLALPADVQAQIDQAELNRDARPPAPRRRAAKA